MEASRTCVCGCGRRLALHLEAANLVAISLIPELVAWDRFRAQLRAGVEWPQSPITPERLDAFLAEGASHYRGALDVVHGEKSFVSVGPGPDRWLRQSRRSRRKLARIAPGSVESDWVPKLTAADLRQLDRRRPETSFSAVADDR